MQTTNEVRFLKPASEIWHDTIVLLSEHLKPGSLAFMKNAELREFRDGVVYMAVFNPFVKGFIAPYTSLILDCLRRVTNVNVNSIEFIIDSNVGAGEYTGTLASIPTQTTPTEKSNPPVLPSDSPESPSAGAPAASRLLRDASATSIEKSNVETSFAGPHAPPPAIPVNIVELPFGQAARSVSAPALAKLPPQPRRGQPVGSSRDKDRANLNPKYIFDTFVVGSNNRFCHSAALAVAQKPGQNYNPLFLYSGVGLGKTHLMQAIGHAVLDASPGVQVRYLSCERFTNELINAIKDKSMVEFRKRYRYVDVLMIDDIQFMEGKESTQEEFFHTFNALHQSGKQLIISSDRPPKALSKLEERLRSRFECGLIADMQAPDYETRLAILQKKCEMDGVRVDDGTLHHIATLFNSNIRELEGALVRVSAYASLTGQRVDQLSLHNLLAPAGTPKDRPTLTVETIISTVAQFYKLEPAELRGAKRSQDLTMPRHIAMYLAYEMINLSYPRIGQAFGNRKHTSALYAHEKIKEALDKDPQVAAAVNQLRRQLGY